MKAEELMINDLVMYNGEIYVIMGVYCKTGIVSLYPVYIKNKAGEYLLPISPRAETVSPIPLTEEILKANGFKNYELHSWSLKEQWQWSVTVNLNENGSVISIDKEIEGYKGVDSCHICYKGNVHELQHALRLCGLNELADNFKIKEE